MSVKRACVVAVVDDDSRVLGSLKNLLESVGHRAVLFQSAEAFLEHHALGEVDCLISDIGMPGMSGIDLRNVVRDARPEVPVFLLTGLTELPPQVEDARRMGQLFIKPLDGAELIDKLDLALNR